MFECPWDVLVESSVGAVAVRSERYRLSSFSRAEGTAGWCGFSQKLRQWSVIGAQMLMRGCYRESVGLPFMVRSKHGEEMWNMYEERQMQFRVHVLAK